MGNRRPRPAHRPREKINTPFARWIESTGRTYPNLAEMLGCSPQAISNIRKGHYLPGRELANRIAEVSRGAVPVAVWDRPAKRKRVSS